MIVQLRAPTGAGKSTLVHRLIEDHGGEVVDVREFTRRTRSGDEERERLKLWRCEAGLHVVGNYSRRPGESVSRGSGGDSINGPVADEMVAYFTGLGLPHLIWESARDSSVMPKEPRLSQYRDLGVVWATLDTPAEECVRRVLRRREERGTSASGPPKSNRIEAMRRAVDRRAAEAPALGIHSVMLQWDHDPYEQLHDLLTYGGWGCRHAADPKPRWDFSANLAGWRPSSSPTYTRDVGSN